MEKIKVKKYQDYLYIKISITFFFFLLKKKKKILKKKKKKKIQRFIYLFFLSILF